MPKLGRVKLQSAFEHAQNGQKDHFTHMRSIILTLALHSYILKYPIILLADSIGPDPMSRSSAQKIQQSWNVALTKRVGVYKVLFLPRLYCVPLIKTILILQQ